MAVSDRRLRERQRRRGQILAAAAAVFAERGVDGASMETIAERAELGKATLYYYFRTKDALHSAVVADGTERFFAQLSDQLQPPAEDLTSLLQALLRGFVTLCGDEPQLVQVLAPLLPHMSWTLPGAGHPSGNGAGAPAGINDLPAHHAFVDELQRLLLASPWADRPDELLEFLNDTFVALAHKHLVGRGQTSRRQVDFVVDLLRGAPPARKDRRR